MAPPSVPVQAPQQTTVAPPQMVQPVQPVVEPIAQPVVAQPVASAPVAPAPVANQNTTPDSGEARFKLPGKTAKVTAAEFQMVINEYAEKSKNTSPKVDKFVYPLKAGAKDYEGVNVFSCFGSYKSDEYCIKCPLRKNCIINR